jgi:hypothetical protein
VISIEIFISCGDEVDDLRNVGNDVLRRLDHMLTNEMNLGEVVVRNWDFRLDAPRVVDPGHLATRSLRMVEKSNALVAIFGAELPIITQQEIRRVCEMRRDGLDVEVFVFVDHALRTPEQAQFFAELANDYAQQIVYAQYQTELEFQAGLFTALTPFVLRRSGLSYSPPAVAA